MVRYYICAVALACLNYIAWKISGGTFDSIKRVISIVLIVLSEPVFFMGMMYLLNMYARNKACVLFRKVIGVTYLIVFLSECFYFGVSGEWISLLALDNINQAYLLVNVEYICIIVIGIAFVITYLVVIDRREVRKRGTSVAIVSTIVSGLFLLIISTDLHTYVHIDAKKVTPVASFMRNMYFLCTESIFNQNVDGYPFRKDKVYKTELSFNKKSEKTPNVIIIFTEGTSARLVGAYNSKYHDVTPYIDEFSRNSMRVDNYYNHTAATFRGTFGQLASSYNFSGVYSTKDVLKNRSFQSLPRMLNDTYTTAFFSPHKKSDAYTDMLETLDFQHVYTRDEIKEEILSDNCDIFHESIKDADMYKALISYLENYDSDKNFFISMYTFNTHLGVELPDNTQPYELDGKTYESVNSLHNLDAAFGMFWQWFIHSKYKDNTIVVFTADHAHFNDSDYVKLVENDSDYMRCFIDRIPLIIYDPIHNLPTEWDANDRTSLDLAPTVCQLIGVNKENSFLGISLFEENGSQVSVAAIGQRFYGIYNHRVHKDGTINSGVRDEFDNKRDFINKFYMYESANKVFY